jgi:hypothetical protein
MRNKLAVIFACSLLFLGLVSLASAYPRAVVMENFTNWG